jgi:hypothetical protein
MGVDAVNVPDDADDGSLGRGRGFAADVMVLAEARKRRVAPQGGASPANEPPCESASEVSLPLRYEVRASLDPSSLQRVANYFVQLGKIPTRVSAEQVEDGIWIVIEQSDLDDHRGGVVADKMRSSVLIESVRLTRGDRVLSPLSECVT